jgi:hypothetical protein
LTGAAKWSSGDLLFNEEIFSVFKKERILVMYRDHGYETI